jgi:hypothetical protein
MNLTSFSLIKHKFSLLLLFLPFAEAMHDPEFQKKHDEFLDFCMHGNVIGVKESIEEGVSVNHIDGVCRNYQEGITPVNMFSFCVSHFIPV